MMVTKEILDEAHFSREIDAVNIKNLKGAMLFKVRVLQKGLIELKKQLEQCKDVPSVSGIDTTSAVYRNTLRDDMLWLNRKVTNYRAYNFVDELLLDEATTND